MILYFADRGLTVLGMASTELPSGAFVSEDMRTADLETGMTSFEFVFHWTEVNGRLSKDWAEVGNYVFRSDDGRMECYTIIDTEEDYLKEETLVYAEDAGLDLLNEISLPYSATIAHTIAWYMERFAYDSGFEIGVNEIPDATRTLSWDGESTMAERVMSVAAQFGAEIQFGFEFVGLRLARKTINILRRRGNDSGIQLRMGMEVGGLRRKASIANVATALYVTGGVPEEAEDPITLSGYEMTPEQSEDGNFFLEGTYLKSKSALQKWSRYLNPSEPDQTYTGHIMKTFSYDTTSQTELCNRAIAELKKISEAEVNYEVDIVDIPETIQLGDTVTVIDKSHDLAITARIIKLETSVSEKKHTATLGEYLIKYDELSSSVEDYIAKKLGK